MNGDFLLPALRAGSHHPKCCHRGIPHTDAAKRISDAVCLHYAAIGFDCAGKWIACKMADGTGGNVLYDNKRDAVRHQLDEKLCCYIRLTGAPMQVCEAEIMLAMHRRAHDNGWDSLTDPDSIHGGRELIPRVTLEQRISQLRALGG